MNPNMKSNSPIKNTCGFACMGWSKLVMCLEALKNPALLLARLYLAQVFFLSGLTKLRDWDITIALFTDEYHVPFLSPTVAAYMGTAGELVLPPLLMLGLFGRFAALGLSVQNVVAAISLAELAPAALQGHQFWGSLLAGLAIWGVGGWSVDGLWAKYSPNTKLGGLCPRKIG